jgi:hypothetical protein
MATRADITTATEVSAFNAFAMATPRAFVA